MAIPWAREDGQRDSERLIELINNRLVVRGDDECRVRALGNISEERGDVMFESGVEIAGRLVGDDEASARDKCPSDGRTLSFTVGELRWKPRGFSVESDCSEHGVCAITRVAVEGERIVESKRQEDILDHTERCNQAELLKHEACVLDAKCAPLGGRTRTD